MRAERYGTAHWTLHWQQVIIVNSYKEHFGTVTGSGLTFVIARNRVRPNLLSMNCRKLLKCSPLITVILLSSMNCQSLPMFEHDTRFLPNNSFIYYRDIGNKGFALNCVTDNVPCCNNSNNGSWSDELGRPAHEGADGDTCLYVTRGDGVISLIRKQNCYNYTSGLWRCDIPNSNGQMQSIYIYISENYRSSYGNNVCISLTLISICLNTGHLNHSVDTFITIHTNTNASVPEFTISCHTHGGPATTVQWTVNGVSVQEDSDHETSQLILDTSLNSFYDNRLRVRGRRNGTYNCSVSNNIRDYLHEDEVSVTEVKGSLRVFGKM